MKTIASTIIRIFGAALGGAITCVNTSAGCCAESYKDLESILVPAAGADNCVGAAVESNCEPLEGVDNCVGYTDESILASVAGVDNFVGAAVGSIF